MMKFLKNKAQRVLADKADFHFTNKIKIAEKYDFIPLMNNRCSFNAIHAVKASMAQRVVEVVVADQSFTSAHYINEIEGVGFVDFTLGYAYRNNDYRFVRYVDESEFDSQVKILKNLKRRLHSLLPFWLRWIDPDDVC